MEPLDRATIWPYRDGEPGGALLPALRPPERRRRGASARRARGRRGPPLSLRHRGRDGARARACSSPGQTIALAEGGYYGTGVLFDALERWGVRHVEFDQTGPPPTGVDLVWLEAPSNPFLTMPDLEAAVAAPGARGGRLDRRDARLPAAARARRRLRAPQRDEVPRRATTTCCSGAVVMSLGRGRRAPARLPQPHGHRRRARPVLAALALAEDAHGADGAAHGERDRDRRAPARAPCGRARALPGLRRPPLVRRRRRRGGTQGRDVAAEDQERHEPRRRRVGAREPHALGGRPRAARPAAPERRPRGRRTSSGPTSSKRWLEHLRLLSRRARSARPTTASGSAASCSSAASASCSSSRSRSPARSRRRASRRR